MTCLNETQIQELADGEGSAEARRHAAGCADCAARVEARTVLMASIARAVDPPVAMPVSLARRVEEGLRRGGATRLRPAGGRLQTERKWVYGLGVAAATLIAILFVTPAIRNKGATVS